MPRKPITLETEESPIEIKVSFIGEPSRRHTLLKSTIQSAESSIRKAELQSRLKRKLEKRKEARCQTNSSEESVKENMETVTKTHGSKEQKSCTKTEQKET